MRKTKEQYDWQVWLFCLLATNDANEHFHEIIVKKKTYGESESNLWP